MSLGYQLCLISFYQSICFILHHIHPFTTHRFISCRQLHKLSSFVFLQCLHLHIYSLFHWIKLWIR
uniref:Uncharacterized protein n=1 Tax=Rhizophora mucronata TaxID=61149 RepID=A0A2P2P1U5_RHIMU